MFPTQSGSGLHLLHRGHREISPAATPFEFKTEELIFNNYTLPKAFSSEDFASGYQGRRLDFNGQGFQIRNNDDVLQNGDSNNHFNSRFSDNNNSSGNKRWRFCQKCQVYKLPRMHHCSVCNKCCVRYDHHCGMALNCIGINNYHIFITFLSSTIFVRKNCTYCYFSSSCTAF